MPTRCQRALGATLFAAVLLALALPAQAQWKWRDSAGHITASDLPPPRDIPDKDILQRPDIVSRRAAPAAAPADAASAVAAAPAASAARPSTPADKDLEARKRAAEQQQQAKARAEEERLAQARAENCKRARTALATLDSGQRIARANDRGEREYLDDRQRAEETRRANDVIASDCR